MDRYHQGDQEAVGEIVLGLMDLMVRWSRRKTFAGIEPDDLLGEFVLFAYTALRTYDPAKSPVVPYIINGLKMREQKIVAKLRGVVQFADNLEPSRESSNAIDLEKDDEQEFVDEVIGYALSPVNAHILKLHYGGMSLAQIADQVSAATSKRYSRSKIHGIINTSLEDIRRELAIRGYISRPRPRKLL